MYFVNEFILNLTLSQSLKNIFSTSKFFENLLKIVMKLFFLD